MRKKRELLFYREYFREFYSKQTSSVRTKILWTLKIIVELDRIPETYLKHLENTQGLYEIRVQSANNIYRIFCFFDNLNVVVVENGFHKKTQKTSQNEIEKAKKIREEYYNEKRKSGSFGSIH